MKIIIYKLLLITLTDFINKLVKIKKKKLQYNGIKKMSHKNCVQFVIWTSEYDYMIGKQPTQWIQDNEVLFRYIIIWISEVTFDK